MTISADPATSALLDVLTVALRAQRRAAGAAIADGPIDRAEIDALWLFGELIPTARSCKITGAYLGVDLGSAAPVAERRGIGMTTALMGDLAAMNFAFIAVLGAS